MAYERNCKLCQTVYRYCPHCSDYKHEPKWKIMFHDENCFTIFNILQLHSQKKYSDEEAAEKLNACDLSVLEHATETIRMQVKDILDKGRKIIEEPQEEAVVKAKRTYRKKSNSELD